MHSTANKLTFGDGITAVQIRIARPTSRLDAVVAFYRDGLGLPELYRTDGELFSVISWAYRRIEPLRLNFGYYQQRLMA